MAILVLGCSSLGKIDKKEVNSSQSKKTQNEKEFKLPPGWQYETKITNKGTRSEGSISGFTYQNKQFPPCFEVVIIGELLFKYKPMRVLWDNHGYLYEKNIDSVKIDSKSLITPNEINKGWYELIDNNQSYYKKSGTPEEWIYVKTEKNAFWLSPEKVDTLIKTYKLESIIIF